MNQSFNKIAIHNYLLSAFQITMNEMESQSTPKIENNNQKNTIQKLVPNEILQDQIDNFNPHLNSNLSENGYYYPKLINRLSLKLVSKLISSKNNIDLLFRGSFYNQVNS